jgi:hypothetical protein
MKFPRRKAESVGNTKDNYTGFYQSGWRRNHCQIL